MNEIKLIDSAISELLDLKIDAHLNFTMKDQIDHLLSELQFLQLYVQCLTKWNETLQRKKNSSLGSLKNPQIKATLTDGTKGIYNTGVNALATQDFEDWNKLASNLHGKIQKSKPRIKEDCLYLLDCSFGCRFSNFGFQAFFRNISDSLDEIVRLKSETIVDIKLQIQGIKEKIHFFAQIFELTRRLRSSNKDLKYLNVRTQAWAACLSLLYWVQDENFEEMPIFFSNPEVIKMFLAVLKHLWSLSHNRLLIDEGVPKFVDFLLEIFQQFTPKDGIQNLRGSLTFLTTFLVDPPLATKYMMDTTSIATEVESVICSLNANNLQRDTAKDIEEMLNTVKGKVSELYARIFLDSKSFDFPRTNVLGFIDSLIDNLREILNGASNPEIDGVPEDLLSIRSFVDDILMKNTDEGLWRRIINVVYSIEISVNMISCLHDSVLYDRKFLSDVREDIKIIKAEAEKFQNQQLHDIVVPDIEMSSTVIRPYVDDNSMIVEDVVGFKDDFCNIVDQLLWGTAHCEVVSVVGMAGQGKTTLAWMVYNDPSVSSHFHMRAWCVVSAIYQRKSVLLQILNGLNNYPYHDVSKLNEEDLAETLYRALKGRKYLIVLDDVWDVEAWKDMRMSFPDDQNGSRILLTTRNRYVAQAIAGKHSFGLLFHNLGGLSDSESWELLQRKIFKGNSCPPYLERVGKKIAKNCKGLPLAIVAVAGLLLGRADKLDWWKKVAQDIVSEVANRGVMDVLELSYKHLPDYLKPCFLYFGAFQAGKVIRTRRLIQLWISEGFVQKSDGKSLEEVAKGYLKDLVSRSLVLLTNETYSGAIKEIKIHDLILEFCLAKVKEEKFLKVEGGGDPSLKSRGIIYKNYRMCIQGGGDDFFATNPLGPCVHSLLLVPENTCLNKGELFSICNFKLLHILDLEDMEFDGDFPEEVTLLVLLRYLAICCPSGTFPIPPSIANIRNLETFRVKRQLKFDYEIFLPDTLWNMKRLSYVDVGRYTPSFSSDDEEDSCQALDNIRTFSAPSLSYGEDTEKLLRRLRRVRKLRCQFDDSCYQNGFPALDVLCMLESLNARYIGSLSYTSFAINFPSTLKKLTLTEFMIQWDEMSRIVKNLHNLEVLKLLKDAFDGKEWNVSDDEFSRLKFLKLCQLNIAQWCVSCESFPWLEHLIVENCDQLEEIPSGFAEICTLRNIEVRWCKPSVASSVMEITEEQRDWGNEDFKALISDIL